MREGVRSEIGHIATLDGMRGLAVLAVVLFHYVVVREAAGFADPWIAALAALRPLDIVVRNGYLGVDLFFLISGFLLALPWFAHANSALPPPSTRAFYGRRVRRIVPAYYVQLALLFLLVMPLLHGWTYWRSDLYVDLFNAFAHGLFLHNTTPLTAGSLGVNGALWTLAVEAQYYLLLPLLAPLFVRAPWTMLVAACLVAALWQAGARHDLEPLVAGELALGAHWHWSEAVVRRLLLMQVPAYLAHFAIGIVLGRAWLARRARDLSHGSRIARIVAGAAAALALYAALAHGGALLGESVWIATTLPLAVLLYLAAAARGRMALGLLGRGALAFVGRVSYSAYLYHLPLLALGNRYAAGVPAAGSLPLYLAVLLAVSWLSWRYIESFRK
jgi:peptidoglycan/LPS O-acetylase OafA/YrhL